MKQTCWDIWPDRGFLPQPDPLASLVGSDTPLKAEIVEQIEQAAAQIPTRLADGTLRDMVEAMPLFDLAPVQVDGVDFRIVERLMLIYSFLGNAYVHMTPAEPAKRLPAAVAMPLYALSQMVDRPPILSYTSYVLTNWRRVDPAYDIRVDNLALLQNFLGDRDEDWFILIHVDIEARAADALQGIIQAKHAVQTSDVEALEAALEAIALSVAQMIETFHRMPEHCNTEVYYHRVRPYIFGFEDVVYEGVTAYGGEAQSFRGQTGAQSSIVPALVEALELEHERSGLTEHLKIMRGYMPGPHREFISSSAGSGIRGMVLQNRQHASLREVYNLCLQRVLEFRQLHLHYATIYIAEKVRSPMGTGGTIFMDWLGQLAEETEAQLIR
ncbi:MAG: hypothetical protein ACOCYT_02710 [Chloroflexota bacterium]